MTYCTQCGTTNPDNAVFCAKCGAPLQSAQKSPQPQSASVINNYYGRQRRRDRRTSGQGGMIAPFIFAAIFIVIGMAVFLPNLPWQYFWGILWLMIGGLIVGFWALRRSKGPAQQPQQRLS